MLYIVLAIAVALIAYLVYAARPGWLAGRGNAEFQKGNEAQAIIFMEKAARHPKAKPQHKIGYGYLLMKAGKAEEAEKVLREAAANAKPGIVRMQAKTNLATAIWLQGRREEAVELLESVHADYTNTTVYGNLGYFRLLLGGDPETALAFNKEAYAYNDSDLTILDNMAQSYYLLGQYEEAAEWYEKVVEKQPKHAESHYYYALTLQQLGREEAMREQARLAKEKPLALVTPLTPGDLEALP